MEKYPKMAAIAAQRHKGSLLAEAAISSFLTVVICAVALDLSIFTLAFMNLDKTARDCARAAGSAVPATGQTYAQAALAAAETELKNHATDGYFSQQPQLVGNALVLYQDWSGSPYNGTPPVISGAVPQTYETPYVTVACSEVVRLPVPIEFFGIKLVNNTNNGTLSFTRQYTFPIVKYNFSVNNANPNM
jgi:hypothetical protein